MKMQKHQAEFLFLGTGGSSGVPMIGCTCAVCTSKDPRNTRLRPSGVISYQGKRLLIDSGPDFRFQALHHHLNTLDGVLLTHSHFDHTGGLDELRIYYLMNRKRLPVLLSEPTFQELKRRFDYLFKEKNWGVSLPAQLDFHVIDTERGALNFLDFEIIHTRFDQAGVPVTGYRLGSFAYISDIKNYPETIFEDLSGVKILVVSALRHEPSLMHFSLEEAVLFAKKTDAEQTYLTHIGHELEHNATNASLPEGVQLAYDGLKLTFEYGI